MKLSDLSAAKLEHIKSLRFDQSLEKHEGPENWESILEYYEPEFIIIDGYNVLLPIEAERLPNISVLRCLPSADGNTLTLFLRDTTYNPEPENDVFYTGRLAICEKIKGEQFFVASVYHEWFIIDT